MAAENLSTPLFIYSGIPSSVFPDTSLNFIDGEANSATCAAGSTGNINFICLLQHAILFKTPIAPLTWQPAFDKLGRDGATGTVSQNVLNAGASLAFKRFKPYSSNPNVSGSEYRNLQFQATINELDVLQSDSLVSHPNIVEFLGLCFELHQTSDEVWPVLTFVKSASGDLGVFREHNNVLEEHTLLEICRQTAHGLAALHEAGVVHGDIKPNNILISHLASHDMVSVQLTDFGFSRFATTTTQYVRMPRTEPWEAPELSYAKVSITEAKRMDVYSFGLICLWLFFGSATLLEWNIGMRTVHSALVRADDEAFKVFQYKKRTENCIRDLAQTLLSKDDNYSQELKARLCDILISSLEADPKCRTENAALLVKFFGSDPSAILEDNKPVLFPEKRIALNWHGSLQMEKIFITLDSCDYRVHMYIVRSLAAIAESSKSCDQCIRNAAFQLLFCDAIGFGETLSDEARHSNLIRSQKTTKQLKAAIAQVKHEERRSDHFMAQLAEKGFRHDFQTVYSRSGVTETAINYYLRVIAQRKKAFGAAHISVWRLQGIVANLLTDNERYDEASAIILEMNDLADQITTVDRFEIKKITAKFLADVGLLEEAQKILEEVCNWYDTNFEETKTTERLESRLYLAQILRERNHPKVAIFIADNTLRECLIELGDTHETTIAVRRCLTLCYSATNEKELALNTCKELVKATERLSLENEPNPTFVQDVCRLGLLYFRLNDVRAARECYERACQLIATDRTMTVHAVNAISNHALELIKLEEMDNAFEIFQALLSEASQYLAPRSRQVALIMGNLAHCHHHRDELDKAEELQRKVLDIRREVLGDGHKDTMTAIDHLMATLSERTKFNEAAEYGHLQLGMMAKTNHDNDSDIMVVRAAEKRAIEFESIGAYSQALSFFHYGIAWESANHGKIPVMSPSSTISIAICQLKLGNIGKGKEWLETSFDRLQETEHAKAEDSFARLGALADTFKQTGCDAESERILDFLDRQGSAASHIYNQEPE